MYREVDAAAILRLDDPKKDTAMPAKLSTAVNSRDETVMSTWNAPTAEKTKASCVTAARDEITKADVPAVLRQEQTLRGSLSTHNHAQVNKNGAAPAAKMAIP